MRRFWKKLAHWALYVLYLLAFFAAVDYFFFYRPWVADLRQAWERERRGAGDPRFAKLEEVRYVEPRVMRLLGKAPQTKASTFTEFDQAKDAGVVRICAFGDSFTEGDEVGEDFDYPTRLGELFRGRGASNVEVLNFGVGGFGLHQTYVMWKEVAPGFGCDFDLLGPRGFQPLRDTTFGFIYSWSPYYLHARYVLADGGVRLVEVAGETYGERFDRFYSFVPRWRYLRYNRTAPAFLTALVPGDRELPNPFYYDRRDLEEEADDTYRALLGKMADSGRTVVVAHHRREIVELANGLGSEGLSGVLFHEPITFPYVEPWSHASPLGNDFLARQHLALLTRREEPLEVIETRDLEWPEAERPRRTLESYSRIDVELGGVRAGRFAVLRFDVSATRADALVTVKSPRQSVADSCFFPLELELQPGMEVVLRSGGSGAAAERPLGRLAVVGGGLNVGRAEVEGVECWTFKELQHLSDRGEPTPLTHGEKRRRGLFFRGSEALPLDGLDGPITVLVGGREALVGERGDFGGEPGVWLEPVDGESFRFLRATRDGLPDLDAMDAVGVVEIVAEHWQDGVVRVPFAAWRKRTVDAPGGGKPPAKTLSIGPDGTVTVEPRALLQP